jgi:hypothetical protein
MRTEFFVLLSVCFHGCFLWSIFSLYFQSPVVEVGARSTPDLQRRLADRLIFIVGKHFTLPFCTSTPKNAHDLKYNALQKISDLRSAPSGARRVAIILVQT